jgi:chromosome transmission fidelity protein 8
MIIPINLSPPTHRLPVPLQPALAKLGSNEVVLIELQGWLDFVEGEKHDGLIGTLNMENVGSLGFTLSSGPKSQPDFTRQDKPILKIGHHHLEGKLVSLSKPLAVLAREKAGKNDAEGGAGSTRYDILTIVKRKIAFSNRPIPIVKRA